MQHHQEDGLLSSGQQFFGERNEVVPHCLCLVSIDKEFVLVHGLSDGLPIRGKPSTCNVAACPPASQKLCLG